MKLSEPTLLLDENKCRNNIAFMADKARQNQLDLQPHFKTHQSQAIGEWFKEEGVKSITVSSLRMAAYFADDGWEEITVAFPVNVLRRKLIKDLSKRVRLNLFVNNLDSAQYLENELKRAVGVFTEINTAYHRSGIGYQDKDELARLLGFFKIAKHLQFQGFYTHAGHTYHVRGKDAVSKIHQQTVERLNTVKTSFEVDFDGIKISLGDTPSCSLAEDFSGVDIIRPGNFVFYDLMQAQIGACTTDDIAVCMACPVVEKHPERGEVIIHGGAVHFSKEKLEVDGKQIFGQVVPLHNDGWGQPIGDCYLKSLSQEHGIVQLSPEVMAGIEIGSWIGILPVHSCLTANLMGAYFSLNGQLLDCM